MTTNYPIRIVRIGDESPHYPEHFEIEYIFGSTKSGKVIHQDMLTNSSHLRFVTDLSNEIWITSDLNTPLQMLELEYDSKTQVSTCDVISEYITDANPFVDQIVPNPFFYVEESCSKQIYSSGIKISFNGTKHEN